MTRSHTSSYASIPLARSGTLLHALEPYPPFIQPLTNFLFTFTRENIFACICFRCRSSHQKHFIMNMIDPGANPKTL